MSISVLRLLLPLCLAALALSACTPLEPRLSRVLRSEISTYVDPGGRLDIAEIDGRRDALFRAGPAAGPRPPAPATRAALLWMRLDAPALLAIAGPRWTEPIVLMLEDRRVQEAHLVVLRDGERRTQSWRKLNERRDASEQGFRYPVFLLDPAELARSQIYLSLRAAGPISGAPRIADFQTFASLYDGATRLLTLVIGVRVAIFTYILALGLSLKSRTNLWLAASVGIGLVLIVLENMIFDIAGLPGGAALARMVSIGGTYAAHFCLIGFTIRFLRVESRAPQLYRAGLAILGLFAAGIVAGLADGFFSLGFMAGLLPYTRLLLLLYTLAAAAAVAPRGPQRAAAFLIAWMPVMGAIALRLVQDLIPEWTPPAVSDAAILSGITLSLTVFAVISSYDVQRRESRLKANARQNAERFKAFAEIGTEASWEVDAAGRLSFVAGRPTPLPRLQLGDPFVDVVEDATSREAAAPLRAAIAGRLPFDDVRLRLADARDREAWISLSGRPILDRTPALFGGSVYRGLIRDVSDEVEREGRRLIEQQVFALGQLAGSVAHEINNLIHPVINLTKRLRARYGPQGDAEGARMLDLIDQSSRQAARVVSELLQTMRGDRVTDVARPLPLALELALEGIRPALPSSVALELVCTEGTYPSVRVGDMLQVLGNLVSNAVHAMNGQGWIRVVLTEERRGAKVVVSDNGRGMEERVRLRALQPFFSTKTDGQGTGVGLYIVQRIVGDYMGWVAIDSAPGEGTSVTIFIPGREESDGD